jgi:hypothetical protein
VHEDRRYDRRRRCFELAAAGVDEFLQGTGAFKGTPSSWMGLRVPSLVGGVQQVVTSVLNPSGPLPTFRFLVATREVAKPGTRIRGIRQFLSIGACLEPSGGTPGVAPFVVQELEVTSPQFYFSDGGRVTWHLVLEPNIVPTITRPLTDAQSFMYGWSNAPALLYQDVAFNAAYVNPTTGAPYYYMQGMTGYDPPSYNLEWRELGGLGNFYDLRFPYRSNSTWNDSLDIEVAFDGGAATRVSLYADVLQTNAASRPVLTSLAAGSAPEQTFIYAYPAGSGSSGVMFWRVGGALVFEDDE